MSHELPRPFSIVLALACVVSGCKSTPIEDRAPPVDRLGAATASIDLLETGRAIYTNQCARCHRAKPVQDHSTEEWTTSILPRMARKAKLTPAQTDAVLAYILAAHGEQSASSVGR